MRIDIFKKMALVEIVVYHNKPNSRGLKMTKRKLAGKTPQARQAKKFCLPRHDKWTRPGLTNLRHRPTRSAMVPLFSAIAGIASSIFQPGLIIFRPYTNRLWFIGTSDDRYNTND